ncbi:MAG: ATP-dependent DNA helicase RecG [Saprospiraceae bacterium]|nr:ATP-dependent DNA helicase RecG [Saprospiraceae bacterium]
MPSTLLESPIEYLKGVGPAKGELFRKELDIHTFEDLLFQFPFRYIDKTQFHRIADLNEDSGVVQLRGILRRLSVVGDGRKKRLTGVFRDESGAIELVWFTGINWLEKALVVGTEYVVFGKVNAFRDQLNIAHPEMEVAAADNTQKSSTFVPVYPSTEKLNAKGLDAKARRRLMTILLERLGPQDLPENMPAGILQQYRFPSRFQALRGIHFPQNQQELDAARNRLKFEELFFLQLRLLQLKRRRKTEVRGYVFDKIGEQFNLFYNEKLPFELTNAQKRVIKEIRRDFATGVQMNRLLQGDVGSGKTIVALMCALMAIDNGFQACIMAPTEILAQQHYNAISEYLDGMDIGVAFLSGNVKGKKRSQLLKELEAGDIHLLIGTHALIEDPVVFKNLGLAITDEQHRFGVAQRARLWAKSKPYPPHVLVMTATPIPRTLAMTLYGDLDTSIIDELPPGRKPIRTVHRYDSSRNAVFGFMEKEIAMGRQVYVVYPLIEESTKKDNSPQTAQDLKDLTDGFESMSRRFPLPRYAVGMVHGRMDQATKDYEMARFKKGETNILVATTVIEVGVDVPNASVMVIENAERFGLSQLHQLRGRVGRGADQSYCILMTGDKLGNDARTRISTMVSTNDGFAIAETDLRLRGPGDLLGTQQSGLPQLRIADLVEDQELLQHARQVAMRLLEEDPDLRLPKNAPVASALRERKDEVVWGRIS